MTEFWFGKAMAGGKSWHIVKTIRLEKLTKITKELRIASTLDKIQNGGVQDMKTVQHGIRLSRVYSSKFYYEDL